MPLLLYTFYLLAPNPDNKNHLHLPELHPQVPLKLSQQQFSYYTPIYDLNNFFITHYNISHINKKGLIFIKIKYFFIYTLRQTFYLNRYIIVAPPVSFEYN